MLRHLPVMHKTWIQSQLYQEGPRCLKENKKKEKKKRIIEIWYVGTHLRDHLVRYHRNLSLVFHHPYDLRILVPLHFLTNRKKGRSQWCFPNHYSSAMPIPPPSHIGLLPARRLKQPWSTTFNTAPLRCLSPQRGVQTAAPRLQATLLYLDHLNTILYTSPAWLCLALWQAVRKVIGEGRKEAKNTVSVWIPRSQERDSRTQAKYEFPTGNPGILIDLRYREIMTLFNLVCTRVRETFANRVHLTSAVCGTHTWLRRALLWAIT